MNSGDSSAATRHNLFGLYRIIAIFAWTALAIAIAIWECSDIKEFKTSNALAMARACIEEDLAFRRWAAGHGGVYVPVTDKTPPTPG